MVPKCTARRTRVAVALVILGLMGVAWPVLAEGGLQTIILRAGESKVLTFPEVSRVAVGQPIVADVRVLSPGEVLVNGKSEGQTTLLIWGASGKPLERVVHVLGAPPVLSARDVGELIGDEQVRVREVSGYLVAEGTAGPDVRTRLKRLEGVTGSRLLDLTMDRGAPGTSGTGVTATPPPVDLGRLASVQGLVNGIVGGKVTLTVADGRVVIGGVVPNDTAHRKTVELVEKFFPAQAVDALAVADVRPLFTVKARLLELDRQAARELGLEWPEATSVGESGTPSGLVLQPLSRLEGLMVEVKHLEESGKAKTLAEPSMTVLDGEEGSLLAGGQIPVPLEVDGRTTVEWKEYGVRLHVRPSQTASGLIRLVARPEVSTLDWANGVRVGSGTVPALRSRWTETSIDQRSGDTLILAGLSFTEETEHHGVVPGLSEIPLLGALFQSGKTGRHTTELAILLTTTRVPSPADAGDLLLEEQPRPADRGEESHGR